MTTRTLSLQLEEDFTTHTAALFVSHANVFQSTIRIICLLYTSDAADE